MNIKDHIRGNSIFTHYRKGFLFYKTDDTGLVFRVPVDDTGDGTFNSTERSMLLMRYIRKELQQD